MPNRYSLDSPILVNPSLVKALDLARWVSIEGTSKTDKTSKLSASFGDGYGQFAPDGISNKKDKWVLTFAPLDGILYQTLLAFYDSTFDGTSLGLSSANAVGITKWFYYTPMGESVAKKWRIDADTWNPTPISQTKWSVTFAITQCFDAGN